MVIRTVANDYADKAAARFINCAFAFQQAKEQGQWARGAKLLEFLSSSYKSITGDEAESERAVKTLLEELKGDKKERFGGWVDMWDGKMTQHLRSLFVHEGLAKVNGDFLMVQKGAADLYMMCLASEMREAIGTPLVTENQDYADIAEFADYGQISEEADRASILLKLEIPFPSKDDVKDISMSKIIRFHNDYRKERKAFREAVEDVVKASIDADNDPNKFTDFLISEKSRIKDAIETHKNKMETIGVRGAGSVLKISAPASLGALPGVTAALTSLTIAPVSAGIILVGGVAISLVAWWAEVQGQRRDEIEKCPWHYLLSLDQYSK